MLRDFQVTINVEDVEIWIDSDGEIQFFVPNIYSTIKANIKDSIFRQIEDDNEIYNEIKEFDKECNE